MIMKSTNQVIAAMMLMAITTAMPAMASNKNHTNNDMRGKVVAVNSKMTVSANRPTHYDAHKKNAYRPYVKTCTFKVSRHNSHKKVVARAEHMKGVIDTKWNPRTRELTFIYDAKVISARHILHFMA